MSGPFKETLNERFIHLSITDSSSSRMFPGFHILPVPDSSWSHLHLSSLPGFLFSHLYSNLCIILSVRDSQCFTQFI